MAHSIYTDDVCKGLKHKVNTASPHFSLWNQMWLHHSVEEFCTFLLLFMSEIWGWFFIIVQEIMTVGVLNIFTGVWHWLTGCSLSSCFYIDFLLVALISHIQERNFPVGAIFDCIIIFFPSLCSLYSYGTDMNVLLWALCVFIQQGRIGVWSRPKRRRRPRLSSTVCKGRKSLRQRRLRWELYIFWFKDPSVFLSVFLYLPGWNLVKDISVLCFEECFKCLVIGGYNFKISTVLLTSILSNSWVPGVKSHSSSL